MVACHAANATDLGRVPFVDRRDPPPYRELTAPERNVFDLGHAVFNTHWLAADTPRAARRDGLGPLFNATSCDACHNEGARARGPKEAGSLPVGMVVRLVRPDGTTDPRYGELLSTSALDGFVPDAAVTVEYAERHGTYPDGVSWQLRVPAYRIDAWRDGPMPADTIIQPRLAPALFGVGLLDEVGDGDQDGRFGWQAHALSVRDQTTKAFALEMGLTNDDVARDDCVAEACRVAPNGGIPEVQTELLAAVLAFQRWLAVPVSAARVESEAKLFEETGCAVCHQRTLQSASGEIAPYTDLLIHDLGPGLADRDAAGRIVQTFWRTAPLWGIGYTTPTSPHPTYLHDGRARSLEEAVLWHSGDAGGARTRFEQLTANERRRLLDWIATL